MAAIKKNEMKAMDEKTASQKLLEIRTELMKLKAQVAVGTNIESPGRIKAAKRNVARLLTVINNQKRKEKTVKTEQNNKKEVNKKA